MSKRKSKSELDISGFYLELTHLLTRYSADCCTGCLGEALITAAIPIIVTSGGICWPANCEEEVELIGKLAKRVAIRVSGVPVGETLQ